MLLFASYLRIPYRYVIVLYVIDRLVQYRIPYSLFVVVRVGNVGLLYHTSKNGYKKWCARNVTIPDI